MDAERFDTLARFFTASGSRRRALALALSGGLAPLFARDDANAHDALKKCKKKGKQKKKCLKQAKKHKAQHARQRTSPPTPVLTYQCPGQQPFEGAFNSSTERFAQTFTAVQSGPLHQIQFENNKPAGTLGNYVVELLAVGGDGKPTNTVLAEATIANDSVPDGISMLTASFSGPPLVAGTTYAAAISRPTTTKNSALEAHTRVDNACAGSAFRQSPNKTGPFTEYANHDLVTAVTVLA